MGCRKKTVYLVTQNAWDTDLLTMPLALGYLKAYAETDPVIRAEVELRIWNFTSRASIREMAGALFAEPPDVLAFSVLGWNALNFGKLSETFRQVRPDGLCVFGGNHVGRQGERVFRLNPAVDVVVDGEGEVTFRELLRRWLETGRREDLVSVAGLSLRGGEGKVLSTGPVARIEDLDVVPSPLLTGAFPLRDARGNFLYDVALMETNRGCPYKCAFCYWGGAVGQKLHAFSRERLREELELLGREQIENLCLCDANFGLTAADLAFVEDLLAVRARYGFPKHLVTSWAKNKGGTFYSIVRILREAGFHSDFTLSLQTLDAEALKNMQRRNMKINQFEDLCAWLEEEGMEVHAELIWGAPGETRRSFLAGYDRVATHITRIATYPLLVLPNTHYHEHREEHQLVTLRDSASDYEFVLSHATMSMGENQEMQRFLFWSRLLGEYQVLSLTFPAARRLLGLQQSEVIFSVDAWFRASSHPAAEVLNQYADEATVRGAVTRLPNAVLHTYLEEASLQELFLAWWTETALSRGRPEQRDFLAEVFRYDWLSRPYHDLAATRAGAAQVELADGRYWLRRATFGYDVPELWRQLKEREDPPELPAPLEREVVLYSPVGFERLAASHEFVPRYRGRRRPSRDPVAPPRRAELPLSATTVRRADGRLPVVQG